MTINEAKRKLSLVELLDRLGMSEHAKTSARCPFHDDKHNSFSVFQTSWGGPYLFKCHAGCGQGDQINFLELAEKLSRKDAVTRFLELAGQDRGNSQKPFVAARVVETKKEVKQTDNPTATLKPFDWQQCVSHFTNVDLFKLKTERGYSREFVSWLKEKGLVGLYNGCIAFPIRDESGKVVAAHYKTKGGESKWLRYPKGFNTRPIVIGESLGELLKGDTVYIFESQWDAFAFMDVSGERSGVVITLGSENGKLVAGLIPSGTTVYAWKQNDELKNGKRAGDEWLKDVVQYAGAEVLCPKMPSQFKDLNDWTSSGGSAKDLLQAMAEAREAAAKKEKKQEQPEPETPGADSTELTSFSSYEADYPVPSDETAFYGLVGDIVRRIDPHTESDKAAVLVHLLTGFGNAVGRNPHAIADGSRHGMNLFFVCVGESSKSRKGTAYSHMKIIFRRVDEDWTTDCLTSGLNSGEGLIYEVRDPVHKRVKQKGGAYSTETVDDGVKDKRRMFVETELSLPLRVMSREGNTLSAVIRAAWDDGDLRTAVKNSPNKATDSHISIGGHVTRDEVRQELTATDQANGFANRFLWLAVKRSKVLPEGGHLADENLNDLVKRLHQAIEFARKVGEILRDDQARELWCAVYPELSEGKTGLLGAITARAEAQVLRLSCIYALLDLSAVVRIEHLNAALALWNYCERSAQWIFRTGTSNKNADRILAALKVTENKGLTKWEISTHVFNRNATKFEIDEALRLLHQLKLAFCVIEKTATKSAERWFLNEANPTKNTRYSGKKAKNGPKTGDSSYSSCSPAKKSATADESEKPLKL